jgi:hypothetical protein
MKGHEQLSLPISIEGTIGLKEVLTSVYFELPLAMLKDLEKYADLEDVDVSDIIFSGVKNVVEFLQKKHKREGK